MSKMVKIIAGLMGGSVASGSPSVASVDSLRSFLGMLQAHRVTEIDTARVYNSGKSEETLGLVKDAATNFTTATKAPGFVPGSLAYDKVLANCDASLKALKQSKIDLYYFHGPDRQTPIEESCKAIHELHQAGKIGAFGISNYRADEVLSIVELCSSKGWLKPTVFQGGYNGLARGADTQLFPTLRKLGIAFYCYSPLAGGFFSKSTASLRNPGPESRMQQMSVFQQMYVNDTSLTLHDKLQVVCEKEGISIKAAALRWLMHHSILGDNDGVILGASSEEQMKENIEACQEGPLPQSVADMFEEMWRSWSEEETHEGRMRYSV